MWCAGTDMLVECSAGVLTHTEGCFSGGCRRMPLGTADVCEDGTFCVEESGYVPLPMEQRPAGENVSQKSE